MNTTLKTSIEKLISHKLLTKEDFVALLNHNCIELRNELAYHANLQRKQHYGRKVYIRGLIEFTNYCKNDCFYCGIRCSNQNAIRYRLSKEEILTCCEKGYALGFRTFVLQGGEDAYFDDFRMTEIIRSIRKQFPDCAITLSLGERTTESFKALLDAGANRYLLREETACEEHYQKLHPSHMSYQQRMQCLFTLKELGYQTGCGFMVGSPFQTPEMIANDLLFIQDFQPDMVGIGPFIHHDHTPFGNEPDGSIDDTLLLLSIVRLIKPDILLPATTALSTLAANGREQGILAGANVIMPNLSPDNVKPQYALYQGKAYSGMEAAEQIALLKKQMTEIGYEIVTDIGNPSHISSLS
ncbi:MAG: [FeFe] hydrogenase H-cluster radical SAM maturase HydE [Lachnospiraceae bacterium]|nr:[FeFe] hydrogenase H-cluster radical SAM maturase HydE [Lachnospiraceae bacterium]